MILNPRLIALVSAILFGLILVRPAVANDGPQALGRVCVAPLPKPTKAAPPPLKHAVYADLQDLSVRVDDRPIVAVLANDVTWVSDLDLSPVHTVRVLKRGKVVESFKFRFTDVVFKDSARPDLCLSLGAFYFTWQLSPVERTGDWCPCWSNEATER
jgi:hypothetical protein